MKHTIFLLILIFISSILFSQNVPIVTNVTGSQRIDGSKIMDIYYDVVDPDADTLFISLQVSDDNGLTYDILPVDTFLSGDVGEGILSGTGKHIIWNAGAETLEFEGTTFKFKVIADDDPVGFPSEWCEIPAGNYIYGDFNQVGNIAYNYMIMKYEVTNLQYRNFLNEAFLLGSIWIDGTNVVGYYPGDVNISAGNKVYYSLGVPPVNCNIGRISFSAGEFIINVPIGSNIGDFDNHPVIRDSWFGTWAFAEHYNWRLPTGEEWEKAARGMMGFDYSYGNTLAADRANYEASGDPWEYGTTPVGYYNGQNGTTDSPSPYGVYDMCGNVFEWTSSWRPNVFPYQRMMRGGSWNSSSASNYLRSWGIGGYPPSIVQNDVGFRCARTPAY